MITTLPPLEIFADYIFPELDPMDLISCEKTCWIFYQIIQQHNCWSRLATAQGIDPQYTDEQRVKERLVVLTKIPEIATLPIFLVKKFKGEKAIFLLPECTTMRSKCLGEALPKIEDMTAPIMRGIDKKKRPFIVSKSEKSVNGEDKPRVKIKIIYRRWIENEKKWTSLYYQTPSAQDPHRGVLKIAVYKSPVPTPG